MIYYISNEDFAFATEQVLHETFQQNLEQGTRHACKK